MKATTVARIGLIQAMCSFHSMPNSCQSLVLGLAGGCTGRPAPRRTPAGTAHPARQATAATLAAAGIDDRPEALLADSGYRSIANLTEIEGTPELLIPPARHGRQGKPRKDGKPSASRSDGLRAAMKAKLASDDDKTRYAKRRETVEPMFGKIKEQQDARRFLRRGRRACRAEWKLLCGTHNLLKALAAHGHPPSGQAGRRLSDHPAGSQGRRQRRRPTTRAVARGS